MAPSTHDATLCIPDMRTRRRDSVLVDLVELARGSSALAHVTPVVELLRLRERAGSTAMGKGVALPHARSLFVARPLLIVARSTRGIDWADAPDPVRLVLLQLAPAEVNDDAWHARLARVAGLVRLQKHRQRLLAAQDADVMLALVREAGAVA